MEVIYNGSNCKHTCRSFKSTMPFPTQCKIVVKLMTRMTGRLDHRLISLYPSAPSLQSSMIMKSVPFLGGEHITLKSI